MLGSRPLLSAALALFCLLPLTLPACRPLAPAPRPRPGPRRPRSGAGPSCSLGDSGSSFPVSGMSHEPKSPSLGMLSTATRTTATVNPLTPSPLNGALVPSGSPATSSALSAQAAPSSSFAAALRKLAKQAEEPRGKRCARQAAARGRGREKPLPSCPDLARSHEEQVQRREAAAPLIARLPRAPEAEPLLPTCPVPASPLVFLVLAPSGWDSALCLAGPPRPPAHQPRLLCSAAASRVVCCLCPSWAPGVTAGASSGGGEVCLGAWAEEGGRAGPREPSAASERGCWPPSGVPSQLRGALPRLACCPGDQVLQPWYLLQKWQGTRPLETLGPRSGSTAHPATA